MPTQEKGKGATLSIGHQKYKLATISFINLCNDNELIYKNSKSCPFAETGKVIAPTVLLAKVSSPSNSIVVNYVPVNAIKQ